MSERNETGDELRRAHGQKWKVAGRLEGIGEYYFSQKLREIEELNLQGKQIINLGIGSPDLSPHPEVIRVLQEESAKPNVHAYQSYKGSVVLRQAMADWYRRWYGVTLDPDTEVLPLMGSKEGILHLCMTYFEEGDSVLVPDPGYPTYASAVRLSGAAPVFYGLKEQGHYYPDFGELDRLIAAQAGDCPVKGIFVNYPHMPTGQLPTRSFFEKLVEFARLHDLLVIHDNPYSFILNDEPMSLLGIEGAKEFVVELNSLSKSQNMAGWRVGMLVGERQKINEVLRFKSNMDSGMFLPLQLAAAKALALDKDWYEQLNAIYRKRREKAFDLLDLLRCDYSRDGAGMFVWAGVPPDCASGFELSDEMLYGPHVFITPGGIFGSQGIPYIRVSLCATEEKFSECIDRVKAYLNNKTIKHV